MCSSKGAPIPWHNSQSEPASKFSAHRAVVPAVAWLLLTDNSLQSADKEQQESCAVAQKVHDAVVRFDHIEIYSGIARFSLHARLLFPFCPSLSVNGIFDDVRYNGLVH